MADWRTRIIRELNHINLNDESLLALPDDQQEAIERVIDETCRALCAIAGHEATRDQCGIPEHDFCLWCNIPMPNQAVPGGQT